MHDGATAGVMRLRRYSVDHPFATLKHRIFGPPRFLLRGLAGARAGIGRATMACNLKRMMNVPRGENSPVMMPIWSGEARGSAFRAVEGRAQGQSVLPAPHLHLGKQLPLPTLMPPRMKKPLAQTAGRVDD